MVAVAKARKWGNSLGVVLPKDLVANEGIEEGDEILVKRKATGSLYELRGLLKGVKKSGAQLKEEAKEGWHD